VSDTRPVSNTRPMIDLPALHDALDGATAAAFAAESGDRERLDHALWEASAAAASAFPPGSQEADALGVILTAIGRAAYDPEAAGGWGVPEPELGD
jgi:hypothetical protein